MKKTLQERLKTIEAVRRPRWTALRGVCRLRRRCGSHPLDNLNWCDAQELVVIFQTSGVLGQVASHRSKAQAPRPDVGAGWQRSWRHRARRSPLPQL